MVKRKSEGFRLAEEGDRKSKKPRTGEAPVNLKSRSQQTFIDPKDPPPAGEETKEVRAAIKLAKRLAKKERRKQRKDEEIAQGHTPAMETREIRVQRVPGRISKILKAPENRGEKSRREYNKSAWCNSMPFGGRMRDLDPVFSIDEEYLIVAFKDAVNVYSTTTSLFVRELRVSHHERVSALALSSTNPSQLYVGTGSGEVQLWDFTTGDQVHYWFTSSMIYAMHTSKGVDSEESTELVYTIDRKGGRPWIISAHGLDAGEEADKGQVVPLRKSQEPITSFKVLEQGRVIIATSGSVLTLGYADHPAQLPLNDISYTWRDVECPEWITCFDVRIVPREINPRHNRSGKKSRIPRTDIVVGGLKGSLHVYDDLLDKLIRTEKRADKAANINLTSRKQHWHRNAVLSVKWSRDGNYIISGGLETTLLIWQLETGSLNTLPHLGAPIEGIVVSPSGSSYAIRLADNSTMILSTAELKPTFSVAGLQLPSNNIFGPQLPYLKTVDNPDEKLRKPRRFQFPAVSGPSGLLCAVPAATSSRVPSALPQHASFLQTVDITSGHQIMRQALTRTKATDLNVGPESNSIQEPDVVLMKLSDDGLWLATVDEWMPPKRDLAALTFSDERTATEQARRREIFLKFWSWDNESRIWALVSRFDDPHGSQISVSDGENRVLDLIAQPSSHGFATVGADGIIRKWKASARQRHGSTVKNKQGQELVNWDCVTTISLDSAALSSQPYTGAKLAYSADGSFLAAVLTSAAPWTIHLIDPDAGTATTGPYGPLTGALHGLGIVDRYLVVLSDQLRVWNLVSQELCHTYTLKPQPHPSKKQPQSKHLAVDVVRGFFAIALPYVDPNPREEQTGDHSQVIVFRLAEPAPIYTFITQHPLTVLTPIYDRKGFVVIDSAADIRTVTPRVVPSTAAMALPTPPATPSRGLQDVYGDTHHPNNEVVEGAEKSVPGFSANQPILSVDPRVEEDDAVVVTQEKLAEALDCGPAYAMPPVTELFERVARLYAGAGEA